MLVNGKPQKAYGAYVPTLPACLVVADTVGEAEVAIKQAIHEHVGMLLRETGVATALASMDNEWYDQIRGQLERGGSPRLP